jgi:hypothetical protein
MTEAFRLFGVGSLLTVGGTSIVVAALALRDAQRSIKLAENRMENLRKEQARLLRSLREERRGLKEELERERDLRLEAQQEVERLNRERLLSGREQAWLAEALDLESAKRLGAERQARQEREGQEQERRARSEAERRTENAERELQKLKKAQQDREAQREKAQREEAEREEARREQAQREQVQGEHAQKEHAQKEHAQKEQAQKEQAQREQAQRETARREEARREDPPVAAEVLLESTLGSRGLSVQRSWPTPEQKPAQEKRSSGIARPAGFPETAAPESTRGGSAQGPPVRGPRKGKKSRRAVWMPHPDDGADGGKTPAKQTPAQDDAPTEMFRRHYDKYLENYQGYLELAEGLYRTRENGEPQSGSTSGREWEERLRRVNDGIRRTTARLDILEEHNPELVTDARISYRVRLAKRHSEMESSKRGRGTF